MLTSLWTQLPCMGERAGSCTILYLSIISIYIQLSILPLKEGLWLFIFYILKTDHNEGEQYILSE